MGKIYMCKRPENSLVNEMMYRDFSDCFGMTMRKKNVSIDDVVHCFFNTSPKIVVRMMQLRDFMVRCLGLKTMKHSKENEFTAFKPGDKRFLFNMYQCNEHEAIIGANDKHLNFRTSLYVKPCGDTTEVLISTVVVFNNNLGRYYMKLVAPFHKIVVRLIMKNMYEKLMALHPAPQAAEIAAGY